VSLALMSGLQKRFEKHRVGFFKPVGQISLQRTERDEQPQRRNDDSSSSNPKNSGGGGGKVVTVDKDAALLKEHFQLNHITYQQTSPVLIPPGYTRNYLDGKVTGAHQREAILGAYRAIARQSDIVLAEGTGHVGVGSIVDASNADVAKLLGASMVLVANGGLGRTFDDLHLNYALCRSVGVPIAGVIINKIKPEKYEQTRHYLSKAIQQKWGGRHGDEDPIPILGTIPDRPFLGCPALQDLERLFGGTLVSGLEHRMRHYRVEDVTLVATSLTVFLKRLRAAAAAAAAASTSKAATATNSNTAIDGRTLPAGNRQRTLYVCHSSRNDILLGYLMESIQRVRYHDLHRHSSTTATLSSSSDGRGSNSGDGGGGAAAESWETAMVVTGCDEYPISAQVLEIITNLPECAPPVLLTGPPTDVVMAGIYNHTPKLNTEDNNRVDIAVRHYEPHIDFDLLLSRVARREETATATKASAMSPPE
jgi:dethiobiotin synthetase